MGYGKFIGVEDIELTCIFIVVVGVASLVDGGVGGVGGGWGSARVPTLMVAPLAVDA